MTRVRWAVRATLLLGVAASVAANVLHARDNPVSQIIAGWPPIALLITIEIIAKIPVHRRGLAAARYAAAAVIAGIAAYVSYHHMAGVAARYGEQGASPFLLPLSVDGLIVVASICLVELGGRTNDAPAVAKESTQGENDGSVREQRQELLPGTGGDAAGFGEAGEGRGREAPLCDPGEGVRDAGAPAESAGEAVADTVKLSVSQPPARTIRKPPPSARERVVKAHGRDPDATNAELAARVNVSVKTIERHRPPRDKVNGRVPDLESM